MASELSMNGRKKIETLQKEFTQKFPYLTLVFLDKEKRAIDISKSLSEVRQAKGEDISIIASLKVNTLEKRFLENFGLVVEVAYQKSNKVVYTKDNVDKTLNELNKWCQENDCQPFEFKKSFTGNTLSSVQEQLFEAIKEYYPAAEAKKINKDNYLDIHVPEINKKRGTHLFFNTAKDGIKIGFYCRDEEFIEEVLSRSSNIEKYAQGIRILNNPLQNDVEEATTSALSFIEEITGEQKEKKEEEISNEEEEIDIDAILEEMGFDYDEEEEEEDEDDSTYELDEQNYQLINALEIFDSETMAMVQMFSQFGITEVGTGSGSWEGNFYTYEYRTEWNEGYLEHYDAISVEALIELLKTKNINDFNQDDLGSLGIGTLRNGNTTYENFKWADSVSKKEIKNAPDEEELCNDGDKQDSEYLWDSPERIEFVVTEDDKKDLNFILINKANKSSEIENSEEDNILENEDEEFNDDDEYYGDEGDEEIISLKVGDKVDASMFLKTANVDFWLGDYKEKFIKEIFYSDDNEKYLAIITDNNGNVIDYWDIDALNTQFISSYKISIKEDEIDSDEDEVDEEDTLIDLNEIDMEVYDLDEEAFIKNAIKKIKKNKTLPHLPYINETLIAKGYEIDKHPAFFFMSNVFVGNIEPTAYLFVNMDGFHSDCIEEKFQCIFSWDSIIDIVVVNEEENSMTINLVAKEGELTICEPFSKNILVLLEIYKSVWKNINKKFANEPIIIWGEVERMGVNLLSFETHKEYLEWINS
jgi:hypothetical protein